ncbi:hypothetical protein IB69_004795 [Xanthomonas citri]|nr:hypothetical protein IB69_004795 [Xanthomonas citri]
MRLPRFVAQLYNLLIPTTRVKNRRLLDFFIGLGVGPRKNFSFKNFNDCLTKYDIREKEFSISFGNKFYLGFIEFADACWVIDVSVIAIFNKAVSSRIFQVLKKFPPR